MTFELMAFCLLMYSVLASYHKTTSEQRSSSVTISTSGMKFTHSSVDSELYALKSSTNKTGFDEKKQTKFSVISLKDFINFINYRTKGMLVNNKKPEETEVIVDEGQKETNVLGTVSKEASHVRKQTVEEGMVIDEHKYSSLHNEENSSSGGKQLKGIRFLRRKYSAASSTLSRHDKGTEREPRLIAKHNMETDGKNRWSKLQKRNYDSLQPKWLFIDDATAQDISESKFQKINDSQLKDNLGVYIPINVDRIGKTYPERITYYPQNQLTLLPVYKLSLPLATNKSNIADEVLQLVIKTLSETRNKKKKTEKLKNKSVRTNQNSTTTSSLLDGNISKNGTNNSNFQLAVMIAKIMNSSEFIDMSENVTKKIVPAFKTRKSSIGYKIYPTSSSFSTIYQTKKGTNKYKKSHKFHISDPFSTANSLRNITYSNTNRIENSTLNNLLSKGTHLNSNERYSKAVGTLLKEIMRNVSIVLDAVITSKEFLHLLSCNDNPIQNSSKEKLSSFTSKICTTTTRTSETSQVVADRKEDETTSCTFPMTNPRTSEPTSKRYRGKSSARILSNPIAITENPINCDKEGDTDYDFDNSSELQCEPDSETLLKTTLSNETFTSSTGLNNVKDWENWSKMEDFCFTTENPSFNGGIIKVFSPVNKIINVTKFCTTATRKNNFVKKIVNIKLTKEVQMPSNRKTRENNIINLRSINKPLTSSRNNTNKFKLKNIDVNKTNEETETERINKLIKDTGRIIKNKLSDNDEIAEYLKKAMNPNSYESKRLLKELNRYVKLKDPSVMKLWEDIAGPTELYIKSILPSPGYQLGDDLTTASVFHKGFQSEYPSKYVEEMDKTVTNSNNNKSNQYSNDKSYFLNYTKVIPFNAAAISPIYSNDQYGVLRSLPLSKVFDSNKSFMRKKLQELVEKMVDHKKLSELKYMSNDIHQTSRHLEKSLSWKPFLVRNGPLSTPCRHPSISKNSATANRKTAEPSALFIRRKDKLGRLDSLTATIALKALAEAIAKQYEHPTRAKPKDINNKNLHVAQIPLLDLYRK